MYGTVNVHEFIYSTSMTSLSLASIIKLSGAASSTSGALIRIGALINKNTFEGGRLFGRGAYWKEGAKSNHYGINI